MREQRKGYSADVAVKQLKNTEKQHFVLQYRGNNFNEFVKKLKKVRHVQTIFTIRKPESCLFNLTMNSDTLICHDNN